MLRWLFAVCLVVQTSFVWGDPEIHYRSKTYTEEEGMLSSNVVSITQAADGAMWFATIAGVARYDGARWQNFPATEYLLPRDLEQQIYALPNGEVYVAGWRNGKMIVSRWDGRAWKKLPLPPQPQKRFGVYVFSGFCQKDNTLQLALAHQQLCTFSSRTQSWQVHPLPANATPSKFQSLSYDKSGTLWALHGNRLLTLSDSLITEQPVTLPAGRALQLQWHQEELYVLADQWLGKLSEGEFQHIRQAKSVRPNVSARFSDLEVLDANAFAFIRNSPLKILQKNTVREPIEEQLYLRDIEQDREGNLWLATGRGALKLTPIPFRFYNHKQDLRYEEVSAIKELQDGRLLLGGNFDMTLLDSAGNVLKYFDTPKKYNDQRILRILQKDNGLVYMVANYAGLGIWNPETQATKWLNSTVEKEHYIADVFFYKENVYVVTDRSLSQLTTEYTLKPVHKHDSRIRKVEMVSDTLVYLLSDNIYTFDGKEVELAYQLESRYKDALYGATYWQGRLLVATLHGIGEAKAGKIKLSAPNGLALDLPVYALLTDRHQNLWVGTANGTYRLDTAGGVRYYNQDNGLVGNEVNRNALIEDRQGNIWIGTAKGASVLSEKQQQRELPPCLMQIHSILSNKGNEYAHEQESYTLAPAENTLEISFAGISFLNETRVNYRYRLRGYDTSWNRLPYNTSPLARYANLPYGTYQFEVQARRGKEKWSKAALSPALRIKRPFRESPYFVVLILGIAAGLGFTIRSFDLQKRQQRLLTQKVNEKTAALKASESALRKKNEELDRFVYSVSHDLKSPLNSLRGLIKVLDMSTDEEERQKMVGLMDASADKLLRFVSELEMYARNQSQEVTITEIRFAAIVEQCLELMTHNEEAQKVSIQTDIEQPQALFSDQRRIEVILNNLISNAVRYQNPNAEKPYVKIAFRQEGDTAEFSVSDNGIGIRAEQLPRIFDMFERGDSHRKDSSGLGLYIVREAVEKLGGEINVNSEPKVGSTFTVKLPNRKG